MDTQKNLICAKAQENLALLAKANENFGLAARRQDVTDTRTPATTRTVQGRETIGHRLAAVRRPRWLLSGLVRCGSCDGTMSVVANQGRLGCSNYKERGTCTNNRTVLRDKLLERVMSGLKNRLLAPELVETFVREFVAEVNVANRERGRREAQLQQEHAKLGRQIRCLLDLMKDGHGSPAMVQEMRELEARRDGLDTAIASEGKPEPVPALHPNLPELYRRKVEALEDALRDPATASVAAEALRSLIDAILIFPGERRGEVTVTLRGDLAAFAQVPDADAPRRPPLDRVTGAAARVSRGSLVAGMRNHLDLLLTG